MTLIADPTAVDLGRPPDAALEQLTTRLTSAHPEVERSRLRQMAGEAYQGLENAPVQNFRLILTERAVRTRLTAERRRPPDQEVHHR